jgi:hypothetical protein
MYIAGPWQWPYLAGALMLFVRPLIGAVLLSADAHPGPLCVESRSVALTAGDLARLRRCGEVARAALLRRIAARCRP